MSLNYFFFRKLQAISGKNESHTHTYTQTHIYTNAHFKFLKNCNTTETLTTLQRRNHIQRRHIKTNIHIYEKDYEWINCNDMDNNVVIKIVK